MNADTINVRQRLMDRIREGTASSEQEQMWQTEALWEIALQLAKIHETAKPQKT